MPNMSTKYRIVSTLITNIPICIAMVFTAQLLGTGKIMPVPSLINFVLAYGVSFLIGMFLPLVPWGLAFASKCGAKPNSLPFGLLVNVVVNLGYVVINSLLLTWFNVILMGGAPMAAFLPAALGSFVPIYVVGYIVSFLWNQPAGKIAGNICGE